MTNDAKLPGWIDPTLKLMGDKIVALRAENEKLRRALTVLADYQQYGFTHDPENWFDLVRDMKKIARQALSAGEAALRASNPAGEEGP